MRDFLTFSGGIQKQTSDKKLLKTVLFKHQHKKLATANIVQLYNKTYN